MPGEYGERRENPKNFSIDGGTNIIGFKLTVHEISTGFVRWECKGDLCFHCVFIFYLQLLNVGGFSKLTHMRLLLWRKKNKWLSFLI